MDTSLYSLYAACAIGILLVVVLPMPTPQDVVTFLEAAVRLVLVLLWEMWRMFHTPWP